MLSGSSILLIGQLGSAISEIPDAELRSPSTWECGENCGSAVGAGLPNEEGLASTIQVLLDRWGGLWGPVASSAGCWYVSDSHGDLCPSSALSERRLLEWDRCPRLLRWLLKGDVHFSLSMGTLMASHSGVSRGKAPLANCNNTCAERNNKSLYSKCLNSSAVLPVVGGVDGFKPLIFGCFMHDRIKWGVREQQINWVHAAFCTESPVVHYFLLHSAAGCKVPCNRIPLWSLLKDGKIIMEQLYSLDPFQWIWKVIVNKTWTARVWNNQDRTYTRHCLLLNLLVAPWLSVYMVQ